MPRLLPQFNTLQDVVFFLLDACDGKIEAPKLLEQTNQIVKQQKIKGKRIAPKETVGVYNSMWRKIKKRTGQDCHTPDTLSDCDQSDENTFTHESWQKTLELLTIVPITVLEEWVDAFHSPKQLKQILATITKFNIPVNLYFQQKNTSLTELTQQEVPNA